jgi:hypothetical protein
MFRSPLATPNRSDTLWRRIARMSQRMAANLSRMVRQGTKTFTGTVALFRAE